MDEFQVHLMHQTVKNQSKIDPVTLDKFCNYLVVELLWNEEVTDSTIKTAELLFLYIAVAQEERTDIVNTFMRMIKETPRWISSKY